MNVKGRPEKLTDDLKRWITVYQKSRRKKLKHRGYAITYDY